MKHWLGAPWMMVKMAKIIKIWYDLPTCHCWWRMWFLFTNEKSQELQKCSCNVAKYTIQNHSAQGKRACSNMSVLKHAMPKDSFWIFLEASLDILEPSPHLRAICSIPRTCLFSTDVAQDDVVNEPSFGWPIGVWSAKRLGGGTTGHRGK